MSEIQRLTGDPQSLRYKYKDNDPQYKGEKLEAYLNNGPVSSRRCRDCFCLFVYVVFWIGLILIAHQALKSGDPKRLASPFDPDGRQCGYGEAKNYPYLYYAQPDYDSTQYVCIAQCPPTTSNKIDCLPNKKVESCDNILIYDTQEFVSVCIPTDQQYANKIQGFMNEKEIEKGFKDIKTSWTLILFSVFLTLLVSFFFLCFMRFCGGVMIWLIILFILLTFLFLGIICLYDSANSEVTSRLPSSITSQKQVKELGGAMLAIGIIFSVVVCYFCRRIQIAISILKTASRFTSDMAHIVAVPAVMFVVIFFEIFIWIYFSLYIISSGTIKYNSTSPFGAIEWDYKIRDYAIYYLFGLFWNCTLTIHISSFVVASTCSIWYFSHGKNEPQSKSYPILISFFRAIFYHLGSLCFGSLIISLLEILRLILGIFYSQLKSIHEGVDENNLQNFCVRCFQCCLDFFERFIRYVSDQAYIVISISGDSFCESARNAFYLIVRHPSHAFITHSMGTIFAWLGRIFICTTISGICYLILSQNKYYITNLYSPLYPTIVIGAISFIIGSLFMSVYAMAGDTLTICLLVDQECNNGKPKSCPVEMESLMSNYQ